MTPFYRCHHGNGTSAAILSQAACSSPALLQRSNGLQTIEAQWGRFGQKQSKHDKSEVIHVNMVIIQCSSLVLIFFQISSICDGMHRDLYTSLANLYRLGLYSHTLKKANMNIRFSTFLFIGASDDVVSLINRLEIGSTYLSFQD